MTRRFDGIEVRQAAPVDVPEMAATRSSDASAGPADTRMAAYLEGRHHPQHALQPRVAYIATVGGITVGYIAGHLTRRYTCDGEVQYLYVAPAHRRGRVASTLLRHLAGWFVTQQAVRICVNVNDDSPGARPFYASQGARPLRRHWMIWADISTVIARQR